MSASELRQNAGRSVYIRIDGHDALGILGFVSGQAVVTSLCYIERSGECPFVEHALTEEEIASIEVNFRNPMFSRINMSSAGRREVAQTRFHGVH